LKIEVILVFYFLTVSIVLDELIIDLIDSVTCKQNPTDFIIKEITITQQILFMGGVCVKGSACLLTLWAGKNLDCFALEVFTKTELFHFIDRRRSVL